MEKKPLIVISVTEFRLDLPNILHRVALLGQSYIITNHHRPVARLDPAPQEEMGNAERAVPKPGFYYHYKHNPLVSVNNHAYEVLNVAIDTETGERRVIYRPLYREAEVYQLGKLWDDRPLGMFMSEVEKEGKMVPRFVLINERRITNALRAIRKIMYGDE